MVSITLLTKSRVMQENLKILLRYLVGSFWDQLVKFENFSSVHSLKVKYEQVFSVFYTIHTYHFLEFSVFNS